MIRYRRPGMTDAAGHPTMAADAEELIWFHTIDLCNGAVTPGKPPNEVLWRPRAFLPVAGRSVLNIGAWDSKYSFRTEKEGAARLVALDHYVWRIDWLKRNEFWRHCAPKGEYPILPMTRCSSVLRWLPGRQAFDYARSALQSSVEPVVADFANDDLSALGTFDVVVFFGVLYHMPEPLSALRRVRKLTTTVAAIESEVIRIVGPGSAPLLGFAAGGELNHDYGNWYIPTEAGMRALCRASGFRTPGNQGESSESLPRGPPTVGRQTSLPNGGAVPHRHARLPTGRTEAPSRQRRGEAATGRRSDGARRKVSLEALGELQAAAASGLQP